MLVIDESAIRGRFEALDPLLDERGRRRFVAAEALTAGHGGIVAVSRATGVARSTIGRALAELRCGEELDPERVRRPGGGRKPLIATDPRLLDDLRSLVEPATRGDPRSPMLWTSKSLGKLTEGLGRMGHTIGRTLVGKLLHQLDYSLQANRKTREASNHIDRDTQFHYINDRVKEALASGNPAISVETKKKELVGDFKNGGREWRPKVAPVHVHDFVIPELGRAVPYGIYDIAGNTGWVSVGIDHDTAAFATNAIRSWWQLMGHERYPKAKSLLITDHRRGGGSNGSRVRLWKLELQKQADELDIPITVCHLPPGASKWNKIEHRLFSFITSNWRGKPLISHQVIVQLIGATTTKAGLKVRCQLDPTTYPAGIKVSDDELAAVNITRHEFHGEGNYTISPKPRALQR
nr:ISAzo13 family transposase [Bradyrhizobium sp. 17]